MENKRVFAGGLIAGAVLTLAVGGCAFVGVTLYQGTKNGSSLEEVGNKTTMEKVNVLEGMIDDYYLEDVSAEDLEQGVYKGLLDALGDPYSVYYTADELETLQNSITRGVTAARNTITEQMQTDNEAAAQANQTLLQEMEKTQQEIETAKKIIQGELRRQGENSYETIEKGFAGTEEKMDDNFRQFGEKLEKQDEKSRDVIEKGFVGAEQKLDALSQQVDADEEKVLEQLAVIVQQLTENAASSSTQLTQYQQNLQTEMETGKSDLTETAMQKYKVLLGVSLSFGIVNFLGVVALLIINLMP